jgi:diguanylate cyclase (GGDEF)-like protein
MQFNPLVLSYVLAAAVAAGVGAVAWRRRSVVGASGLALLMLAVAWWLLANALEAAATDRTAKIVWSVVAYPGIVSVPVLYLTFVLGWTRQDAWLSRGRIALLLVVPLISVAMAATNEWHHLLWSSVTLIQAWGVTAVYEHGPWFWVEMAYAYTLVGAGLLALVVAMYRYPAAYSIRLGIAIAASLAPIAASIAYAAGLGASTHADLSSITFAIAGVIAGWAVLRGKLLDLAPVAWARLVDTLADAVLVLDPERRIAAFNPSAARLLGMGGKAIGQAVDDVLAQFPELATACVGADDRELEIRVGTPGAAPWTPLTGGHVPFEHVTGASRWFALRATAIADERKRGLGCLVVLRDVTDRHEAVESIRMLSLTDDLTGLLNRRGFATLAEQQMRTAMRTRNRLWLLFADLDDLKGINDRLGHEAGDRALRDIAHLLTTSLFRKADIVARLGGDEFAVFATEISSADGSTLTDRFEVALRKLNETPDRQCALSVSLGVALFDPDHPLGLDELLHEADRRMYEAKHGRQAATEHPDGPDEIGPERPPHASPLIGPVDEG